MSEVVVPTITDMKETNEVIMFLQGLAETIKGVEADGQIDWKDARFLPHLIVLAKDAIAGADGVIAEFKGASGEVRERALEDFVKAAMSLVEAAMIIGGK